MASKSQSREVKRRSRPTRETEPIPGAVLESIDDPLITGLLTEQSRHCRKSLLLSSTVALAITWGGLFPDEINFQGVHVSNVQRANLLYLLSAIVLYFLAVFVVYAVADWRLRKVRFALRQLPAISVVAGLQPFLEEWPKSGPELAEFVESAHFKQKAPIMDHLKLVTAVKKVVKLRVAVDVLLPAAIGAAAVAAVVAQVEILPSPPVLLALSILLILVSVGLLIQSRWFRSRWRRWLVRWGFRGATALLRLSRLVSQWPRIQRATVLLSGVCKDIALIGMPGRGGTESPPTDSDNVPL